MNTISTTQSVSSQIRALLATKMPDAEIAATIGVPISRVYGVRSYDNLKTKPKSKKKTKSKKVAASNPVSVVKRKTTPIPTTSFIQELRQRLRSIFS